MSPSERAVEARRIAFALLTATLTNDPTKFSPEVMARAMVKGRENELQALCDVLSSVTWLATGAVLHVADYEQSEALKFIQAASLAAEQLPSEKEND